MSRAGLDTLRMEVVRIGTVRSTPVLLAVAVALGTLTALLLGLLSAAGPMSGEDTSLALSQGGDLMPFSVVGVVVAMLAVTTVSHDQRYRLARVVLVAQPRRGLVVAARLTVLAAIAAPVALLDALLGAAACTALGRRPLLDGATLRVLACSAAVAVAWAWLGAALTWILRHAVAALAVLLLGPLVVEPALWLASQAGPASGLHGVLPWLPFAAARQAVGRDLTPDGAGPGPLLALADLGVVTLLVIGAATLLVRHRDA